MVSNTGFAVSFMHIFSCFWVKAHETIPLDQTDIRPPTIPVFKSSNYCIVQKQQQVSQQKYDKMYQ